MQTSSYLSREEDSKNNLYDDSIKDAGFYGQKDDINNIRNQEEVE